jgi:hypothetical protein
MRDDISGVAVEIPALILRGKVEVVARILVRASRSLRAGRPRSQQFTRVVPVSTTAGSSFRSTVECKLIPGGGQLSLELSSQKLQKRTYEKFQDYGDRIVPRVCAIL